MYCVETNNLTHSFSANAPVLKSINLRVPEGSIYGFLGPNGAGKTTTLRLLLGLIRKQQGELHIFGKPLGQNRIEILKKVGSMIESPSLYGHLTAKENLVLLQKIYRSPSIRIDEVLNIVGIPNTGNKKVSQFSLGMKQRLSIAVALLNHPSLLILDEPTNGLDPYGIIEIRDLLKNLNEEHGVTIIISSHLLAEIEKLVTHVGIISHGQMVFQDTLKELTEKQYASSKTILHCSDIDKAINIIRSLKLNSIGNSDKLIFPALPPATIAQLLKELVNNNIDVYELSTVRKDLETIFMDLINQS
ncbi:MAG: ABC transporter ATP-binding protein [Sphingobacteriales bacterium]|nr:MAG: ABC transporter ATP-binding protein [Sphingobacteriales bacterium]